MLQLWGHPLPTSSFTQYFPIRVLVASSFFVSQGQNLVFPLSRTNVKLGSSSQDGLGVGFATQKLQLRRQALPTSSFTQYFARRALALSALVVNQSHVRVFPLSRMKVKLESSSHGPSAVGERVGARVGARVGGRVGERVGGGGGLLPP